MSTTYRHFVDDGGRAISARVGTPLLDHLAATHTEVQVAPLDAVVVEGPLPEVDPERPGYSGYVGLDGPGSAETKPIGLLGTAEQHIEQAKRHLALAQYRSAHPPVDEEQVRALTSVLREFETNPEFLETASTVAVASRLVQRGVRVEGAAS